MADQTMPPLQPRTDLGAELLDLVSILKSVGASRKVMVAAVMRRIGVDPYYWLKGELLAQEERS